jgi:hypothetical protein
MAVRDSGAPLAIATQFDGVNDYAEVTGLGLPAPADFTAMGWVVPTNLTGFRTIFDTRLGTFTNGWVLRFNNNQLQFLSYDTTGATGVFGTYAVGVRIHLAFTVTGGVARFYLDGGFIGSLAVSGTSAPSSLTRMRFGMDEGFIHPFQGRLAAWSVYQRALSVLEIVKAARSGQVAEQEPTSLVALYPFTRLAPTLTQSPDGSGNGRHLSLINMVSNPIAAF